MRQGNNSVCVLSAVLATCSLLAALPRTPAVEWVMQAQLEPSVPVARDYIYRDTGSGYSQTARLSPDGPAAWDRFGRSVSLSGDSAVVGARNADFGAAGIYVVPEAGSILLLLLAACCPALCGRRWAQ